MSRITTPWKRRLQIVERDGGDVTVVTVGGEDDEDVLRREMAMGANTASCSRTTPSQGSDGRGIATILRRFVQQGQYDLILTGVQAEDGAAQVGGMLAAMLDYPFASLVNAIEALDGGKLKISREDRGRQQGDQRDRPALRALDPDRHQRAALRRHARHPAGGFGPDSRTLGAAELGLGKGAAGAAAAKVQRLDYFVPPAGRRRRDAAGQPAGDRSTS